MEKLLVIGQEGRLERYTADRSLCEKYDITYVPVGTSDEEILRICGDADFILVDAIAGVSAYLMERMPRLKLIHSEGVGYQGVDVRTAKEKNIYVCNCKGMNAMAVAEQTVMLMLGLLRDVCGCDASVRNGRQIITKEKYMMEGNLTELGECTVGLIGFGDIAKAAAGLLRAFGSKIAYYKPNRLPEEEEKKHDVTYMGMDQLLAQCDIVSLHLPANDETRHMAGDDFFAKMKTSAYIVNTSRGELVDNEALIRALQKGEIAGAGLDTIDGEPVQAGNPLLTAPPDIEKKLLLSCHIGGITRASFRRGYDIIWSNIEKVSRGEVPDNIVNM